MDAMAGRSTSLKTNYMLDNKEINKYLQSLSKSKNTEDRTNAKKWKDAFNKTGTVNNKQEYLDLLVNYVRKETKYSGLTERYSKTMNGLMDRLQGNWETVEASLLGIDANGTGMAKGGINVFNSIKQFLDYMDKWLSSSNASVMFDSLGTGLGKAVDSVAKAIEDFIGKINWSQVGGVLEKMGDSVARVVNTLASSPAFIKLLDTLPDILERILNSKVIDTVTKTKQAEDIANNKPAKAVADGFNGWWVKSMNNLGTIDPQEATKLMTMPTNDGLGFFDNLSMNVSELGMQLKNANLLFPFISPSIKDKSYLTDSNASTYLDQNSNLTEDQKKTIKDTISADSQNIYNITIGEIKANNFDEIMKSLDSIQSNQK